MAVTDAGRQPKGHDAMVMPMNRLKSKYVGARQEGGQSAKRRGKQKAQPHQNDIAFFVVAVFVGQKDGHAGEKSEAEQRRQDEIYHVI